MWDEPEKTTETIGTTARTKTATYDAAGRPKTTSTTSTVGTALPTVTNEYNSETGALVKQSTTTEGKTKAITEVINTLGQLTSYTDASENTATYEYDVDGRVGHTNDGKGTQTATYDATTGFQTKLVDSAAGTFMATYDAEGSMLTEGYPNGMMAKYVHDPTGQATALEYVKTTHCTEKCTWFSDTVTPSIHGQVVAQASTLSTQAYVYDAAGRLTQVQQTPNGKGCTTRLYAYDEDTNRTSLTTREPGPKGECQTTGGTVEKHSYDSADRLVDSGAGYSTFGNLTALPAADAGGSELTSAYYVDNQLQSQTQNGQTIGYSLDPAGRTLETIETGTKASDVISHYAGPSNFPAWTTNTSSETTRSIPAINGQLAAVQNNTETPVLQLSNLHGDIIATAYLSETATELASKADTSEFGVPTTSLPPKYSWLGAIELPTELPSGVVAMGARSYVPQLGRFLQPDPIPGGSANAYAYTFGDPVNTSDPSGAFAGWFEEFAAKNATQVAEAAAAREAAARLAAEEAARAAAEAAQAAAGPQYVSEGIEEWGGEEEWGEEEWGEEYASYHNRELEHEVSFGPGVGVAVADNGEGRIEDAVVRSSLAGGEEGGSKEEVPPSERCGAGTEEPHGREVSSERGQREDVQGPQCRKRAPGWYRNRVRSPGARATHGRGRVVTHGGAIVGCIVGGVLGATFAGATTVGLGTEAGAYGGCFITGGAVVILEQIF
jgi:RHS repeat-associated protein